MNALMTKAYRLALELPNVRGHQRVSCLIVDKRDRILTFGVNDYLTSHPYQKKLSQKLGFDEQRIFLHAETQACLRLRAHMKPYKAVICRVGRTGELLPSCPCTSCQEAFREHGIKVLECTL